MKISEATTYPHPVLAPWSKDVSSAAMSSKIETYIFDDGARVGISYDTSLEHFDILKLLYEKKATFGVYVICRDTGLRELKELSFPSGSYLFERGALLGRVQLRPMIWTREAISDYMPLNAHPEYAAPMLVEEGQFLALDNEYIFDVAHPNLPPIESIFEISENENLDDGNFSVDTGGDRVVIRMSPNTYRLVQRLREASGAARACLMSSLYAPAIMEILEQLKSGSEDYEHLRWIHPFLARCSSVGVDIENPSLLSDAQRLLGNPFAELSALVDEG